MTCTPLFLRHLRRFPLFAVLPIFLVNILSTPADAGIVEATSAFSTGKYDIAMTGFRELATGGNSEAEFMLGVMYYQGYSVTQNRAFAAVWFHKAALKGHSGAQLAFGSIHIRGVGVYQNLNQAFKWLTLAAASGSSDIREKSGKLLQEAQQLMTPDEIRVAREEALKFKPVQAGLIRN